MLLMCSNYHNDVPREPQQNISMAAVRGAMRPSIIHYQLPSLIKVSYRHTFSYHYLSLINVSYRHTLLYKRPSFMKVSFILAYESLICEEF